MEMEWTLASIIELGGRGGGGAMIMEAVGLDPWIGRGDSG